MPFLDFLTELVGGLRIFRGYISLLARVRRQIADFEAERIREENALPVAHPGNPCWLGDSQYKADCRAGCEFYFQE